MTQLVKYEAARRALAEAKAVDEVLALKTEADARAAYARIAKDKTLEVDAMEIRLRAERRLGELIAAQKATVGLNTGTRLNGSEGGSNDGSSAVVADDHRPTLAQAGISKDLSARAQRLAAVPAEEFEAEVADWRERVSAEGARVTARLEKAGEAALAGKTKPERASELDRLKARISELEIALMEAREAAEDAGALAQDLVAISEGDEAKRMAQLEAELKAVKAVRDQLMRENSELKRQVRRYEKKLGIK